MEQFLDDIRRYAAHFGVKPTTIVQRAGVGSGQTWARWETRRGTPTMATVEKLRRYMADNPPPKCDDEAAA